MCQLKLKSLISSALEEVDWGEMSLLRDWRAPSILAVALLLPVLGTVSGA